MLTLNIIVEPRLARAEAEKIAAMSPIRSTGLTDQARWLRCLVLMLPILLGSSCSSTQIGNAAATSAATTNGATSSPEAIFFPRLLPPPTGTQVSMAAVLRGRLIDVGGCLRVRVTGASYLLIWPQDYTLVMHDGNAEIHDGNGRIAAQVGQQVDLAGGEYSGTSESWFRQVQPQVVGRCPGPYWVVGGNV